MPQNSRFTFEICVETPEAITASAAFADRLELCGALDVGGITPDIGMMELA
jgi:copper homeostasis protein